MRNVSNEKAEPLNIGRHRSQGNLFPYDKSDIGIPIEAHAKITNPMSTSLPDNMVQLTTVTNPMKSARTY